MLCRKPHTQGMAAFPCGQCMPCRYNKRRIWQQRILLESLCYSDNAFVTLTYAVDKEPAGRSVVPQDLTNFFKRLRYNIAPLKIRYFAVGEYGDVNARPHYHAALFGYPHCTCYINNRGKPTRSWKSCSVCSLIRDTWQLGLIHVGCLEKDSAGYIAGYVTKKMTAKDDERLNGRHPEFARMSLKPGIGANFMWDVASTTMQHSLDETMADVPAHLNVGGGKAAIGRYLRQKYREMIGREKQAPQVTLDAMAGEMLPVFMDALKNKENPSFKNALIQAGEGRYRQLETKNRIYKQRRQLP